MNEEIRELLGRIYDRLTKIETILDIGDFETRLKVLESELATMRGHRAVLTVIASVALSAAVSLLLKVIS
jgi:hypothetical protein